MKSLAFSSDSKFLVTPRGKAVDVWDAWTAERIAVLTAHTDGVSYVAISPDCTIIASAGGDTVRLWDAQTHRQLYDLEGSVTADTIGPVMSFSPDSKMIAIGGTGDVVALWDTRTGRRIGQIMTQRLASSVAFNPKGSVLAIADYEIGNNDIQIWDAWSHRPLANLRGHTDGVEDLAFSPDGTVLASIGGPGDRSIRLWNLATGASIAISGDPQNLGGPPVFSPDGTLAVGSNFYDARNGALLRTLDSTAGSIIAFSPDNAVVATNGVTVQLLDARHLP